MLVFYLISIIIVGVCALLSFFFALAETSVFMVSKFRLRYLISHNVRGAKSLERLLLKLDKLIAAILIGNNLVNIIISVVLTTLAVVILGPKIGSIVATIISALGILIFCEITPKILATKHAEAIALKVSGLLGLFIRLFSPLIAFFTTISNLILRFFGITKTRRSPLITEEELRLMIEIGREEGVVSDEERKLLHRIFEFGDISVGEVMVPKEKIVAVNINLTNEELLNTFVEQGHARLPVYKDSIDNIVGVIYARDLLYILREKGLFVPADLVHSVTYVKADYKVHELLQRFQWEKIQIAIVVDAQKKTLGLVTLEDLIEEIVGEIEEVTPQPMVN